MAARRKSKGERSGRRNPKRAHPAPTLATEESRAPLPSEELAATEESRATAASTTGELPMNRDFEFKELLRAYRAGIITEKTFETEMAALEHGVGANSSNGTAGGFRAFGKNYASEREAVLTFLDMAQAAEAN